MHEAATHKQLRVFAFQAFNSIKKRLHVHPGFLKRVGRLCHTFGELNADRMMDPELAAREQALLMDQMIRTMGLLLITYLPLQFGAIASVRHWLARLAAGLPILLMLPFMITGFQTKTYEDGSLFGIGLIVVSVPVMIYLALFVIAGLASRAANKKTLESESTDGRGGNRLSMTLWTLAVLFGVGAIVFFLTVIPR